MQYADAFPLPGQTEEVQSQDTRANEGMSTGEIQAGNIPAEKMLADGLPSGVGMWC